MKTLQLDLPLTPQIITQLQFKDKILLSGALYTARDQAHARLSQLLLAGAISPLPLAESALFYCGPTPTPPGRLFGVIGPTTSARMDKYTPLLLEHGLKVMIGKGERSPEVEAAIRRHGAVYLICVGGIAALLSRCVVSAELFLWPELGAEAVYRLVVQDLPCYVAIAGVGK